MLGLQSKRFRKLGLGVLLSAGIYAFLVLSGCGNFFPSANQITALSISPLNATIMVNGTQQYTATATFGNNTQGDATEKVTWSSSATNMATISSAGLATAGTTLGSTTISAKSGSVIANTLLTVSNKTISSISLSPANTTILNGTTQQYTATATYSDGTTGNITNSVAWSSSVTSVATITSGGLATAVGTGTTTITATSGSISGTTQLTVQ